MNIIKEIRKLDYKTIVTIHIINGILAVGSLFLIKKISSWVVVLLVANFLAFRQAFFKYAVKTKKQKEK